MQQAESAKNETCFKKIEVLTWILMRWQIMKNGFEKWTPIVKTRIWVITEYMKASQHFGVFHLPQGSRLPGEK